MIARYLAFASEKPIEAVGFDHIVGASDSLAQARAFVDKREPDGMCVYEIGTVFDTKTCELRDWKASTSPTGDDKWFAPRSILVG